MLDDQMLGRVDFVRREAMTPRQTHGIELELRLRVVAFHMDVRRLPTIARVEEQSIRPAAEYCGHFSILAPGIMDDNLLRMDAGFDYRI